MSAHLTFSSFAAVGAGAAVGAWLRWGLGLMLNSLFPLIPIGTLVANLTGGLLMGVVLALIQAMPALPAALKLMLATGLLGGLTTFSSFSAESFHLMQRGEWAWLAGHTVLHVAGSLLMTWVGFTAFNALRA